MKIINNNKGLTLVEVLVSIAILGIIITPLASLFVSSVRNNTNAQDRLIANQVAQRYMEQLIGKDTLSANVSSKVDTDTGMTVTFNISKYGAYENSTGSLPSFDATINAPDRTNGDTINIENTGVFINEILLTNTSTDPIDIGIICNVANNMTLNVSNNTTRRVNIYKVYSSSETNKVTVNTTNGQVYIYENIYDSSISDGNKNMVFKIKITVSNKRGTLAELVTFKTIK
ncbi:type II secretion system protein [Anaeromicrobium sediminis]|uniref:Prepilin-type cleavage/methylation domain-containing protein n=1 Tax=Anaeromicrobium sediminis TaxID=1478221 RepID=A0A267MG30_9FIRM|nr:type II secretion system protein [Anaeromicrobium sediminis]PAB58506.1 hypothetical protein CCE28_14465 [Anaeromicrobium sediminis]